MDKYGIDNVRGGSYVSIKLDQATINVLQKMNNTIKDTCFNCHKVGHYAQYCPTKKGRKEKKKEKELDGLFICGICNTQFTSSKLFNNHKCKTGLFDDFESESESESEIGCFKCGRDSHYASECYAKTPKKNYYKTKQSKSPTCYRCGRVGHYSSECYAKTHI